MMPIAGGKVKGKKRANPIKQEVGKITGDVMQGGGFYQLLNIRESKDSYVCYDIYLLAQSIENRELQAKMKTIHEINTQAALAKVGTANPPRRTSVTKVDEAPIYLSDIKEGINGCARIIKYNNSRF